MFQRNRKCYDSNSSMEEANISYCKNFSKIAFKQLGQELKVKEQNFKTEFDDGHCHTVSFDSTNSNHVD